jgi:hypothetical protein
MPVLWAHAAHIWLTACEARNRAIESVQKDPNAWPSDSIVAIVLSAASTEAFINELAELIAMTKTRPDNTLSRELRAFADVIEEIEDSRGSLVLKYLMAAQTLRGFPFEKGANPFQDFATLITLRNDIMHLKPRDTDVVTQDGGESIAVPKYVVALQQRGLARTLGPNIGMSWFNRLQTADIASWATKTARDIILAVLELIPDDEIPGRDPAYMFKRQFRNPVL